MVAGSSAPSPSASFHTTTIALRGSKSLDWFHRATKRIEADKTRVDPPVFPAETLHGKKRARVFLDIQFGGQRDATPQPAHSIHSIGWNPAKQRQPAKEGGAPAQATPAAAGEASSPAAAAGEGAKEGGGGGGGEVTVSRSVVELADDIVPFTVENFLRVSNVCATSHAAGAVV